MKQCTKCKEYKPLSEFYKRKDRKCGIASWCKICRSKEFKAWRERNAERHRENAKRWARENPERKKENDRRTHILNPHKSRDQSQRWIKNNPEKAMKKARRYYLKSAYGLTEKDYEKMVEKQEGRCAICGIVPSRNLVIDHDHKTGKVRELLCNTCNVSLGGLENHLLTALNYVNKHREINEPDSI